MSKEESRLLGEKGLSFFGIITASLSHEISNVIATINELSGLLNDLLLGAEQGRPLNTEKLKNLSGRIAKQVKTGEDTIKKLNRFAHSIDDPLKDFDLKGLLEEITTLAERFAFLKRVPLQAEFANESMTVRSDPFKLQQSVFICIGLALENSKKDEAVVLRFNRAGPNARIEIAGISPAEREETNPELALLSILMKDLGGAVEYAPADGDNQALVLTIPGSAPADNGDTETSDSGNK